MKKGPKNRKIAIFVISLQARDWNLFFTLNNRWSGFMKYFSFYGPKTIQTIHFLTRKRLKLTHDNRNISKTTWNFDKRSRLVNLSNSPISNNKLCDVLLFCSGSGYVISVMIGSPAAAIKHYDVILFHSSGWYVLCMCTTNLLPDSDKLSKFMRDQIFDRQWLVNNFWLPSY